VVRTGPLIDLIERYWGAVPASTPLDDAPTTRPCLASTLTVAVQR